MYEAIATTELMPTFSIDTTMSSRFGKNLPSFKNQVTQNYFQGQAAAFCTKPEKNIAKQELIRI